MRIVADEPEREYDDHDHQYDDPTGMISNQAFFRRDVLQHDLSRMVRWTRDAHSRRDLPQRLVGEDDPDRVPGIGDRGGLRQRRIRVEGAELDDECARQRVFRMVPTARWRR